MLDKAERAKKALVRNVLRKARDGIAA
jgi:hypothetical protein